MGDLPPSPSPDTTTAGRVQVGLVTAMEVVTALFDKRPLSNALSGRESTCEARIHLSSHNALITRTFSSSGARTTLPMYLRSVEAAVLKASSLGAPFFIPTSVVRSLSRTARQAEGSVWDVCVPWCAHCVSAQLQQPNLLSPVRKCQCGTKRQADAGTHTLYR